MTGSNSEDFISKRPFPAYDGDDPYIFISYSHKDADKVFSELKKFKNEKYNIWYDQGIDVGIDWDDAVAEALENCSLFVCFISKNSLASQNVINEIKFAYSENKDIVLIYLDDSKLFGGLKLNLGHKQAILKYSMGLEEYTRQWKKAFGKYISVQPPRKPHNFEYLNNLIHSGVKTITLDFNIKIDDFEKSKYSNGIDLDVDNLVIDGNNHFIDGNDVACIFNITGKNIRIMNCTFENGHNSHTDGSRKHEIGGGAIFIDSEASVSFKDCKFLNNYCEDDGGAIFNKGTLTVKNCNFENNSTIESGGAIANFNKLDIFGCVFKENKSHNGGAIYNYHNTKLSLNDSKLRYNSSDMFAGAIYNYGILTMDGCSLSNNLSKGGGAIMNYGRAEFSLTSFKKNTASSFGGAIFNMARNLIRYSSSHSDNPDDQGYIEFNVCDFASNSATKLGGVICNLSKANFKKCVFGKNSASNFSHIISNGPEGILNTDNSVELSHFISVLSISRCEFRIMGNLGKNAIYNQRNCLLSVSRDTIINKQPAEINSNIFSNVGKIEFN